MKNRSFISTQTPRTYLLLDEETVRNDELKRRLAIFGSIRHRDIAQSIICRLQPTYTQNMLVLLMESVNTRLLVFVHNSKKRFERQCGPMFESAENSSHKTKLVFQTLGVGSSFLFPPNSKMRMVSKITSSSRANCRTIIHIINHPNNQNVKFCCCIHEKDINRIPVMKDRIKIFDCRPVQSVNCV